MIRCYDRLPRTTLLMRAGTIHPTRTTRELRHIPHRHPGTIAGFYAPIRVLAAFRKMSNGICPIQPILVTYPVQQKCPTGSMQDRPYFFNFAQGRVPGSFHEGGSQRSLLLPGMRSRIHGPGARQMPVLYPCPSLRLLVICEHFLDIYLKVSGDPERKIE
jgi:hypothetical protein